MINTRTDRARNQMEPEMETTMDHSHRGHRKRLKKRFLGEGLDNFSEHNALELLLFFAQPQKDVNDLAHDLVAQFGNIAGVLEAPYSELLKVKGVGEHIATLIKFIPALTRYYLTSRTSTAHIIDTTEKAGQFLLPRFHAHTNEIVVVMCLDAKCMVRSCSVITEGSVNAAEINIRRVMTEAITHGATSIILAHNHPSGIALPSREDELTTRKIRAALETIEVTLIDHIVVADDDFVSMADSGMLSR